MKRPLGADELRLWAAVAKTVRPGPGRAVPEVADAPLPPLPAERDVSKPEAAHRRPPAAPASGQRVQGDAGGRAALGPTRNRAGAAPEAFAPPSDIEPLRKRRLVRGRDPIEGRLDLHGLDQDRARSALERFLLGAHADGRRAVLIITGKGALGDGVLRRRVPEWLAASHVRPLIAGFSSADRRHGGAGALYVALKRRRGQA